MGYIQYSLNEAFPTKNLERHVVSCIKNLKSIATNFAGDICFWNNVDIEQYTPKKLSSHLI
jgi:hypothetical protein